MTRRFLPLPALARHPAWLIVAAATLSCIGDAAGPGTSRPGQILLQPSFVSVPPRGVVTINRAHVRLVRRGQTTAALDTTVTVALTDSTLELTLRVAVLSQADTFQATIELLSPAGLVLFRAGPLTVVGYPSQGTGPRPPAQEVTLAYVGVGFDAASVEITTATIPRLLTADTLVLAAVAKRADGTVVPGTPIGWSSLDLGRATVPAAGTPRIVGGSQRGDARIVAELFTGQKDTVLVPVQLLPAIVAPISGAGQTAVIRSLLPQPLVARARASDSLPVVGIWIRFQVTAGGGAVTVDSALSDANGQASTSWTLGGIAGTQQVRVTTPRVPALVANFVATALAGTPVNLGISAGNNQNGIVGTVLAVAPAVIVKDADSNVVAGAQVTFAVGTGGGGIIGSVQSTDAAGIARVGAWSLGTVTGPNTLVAFLSGGAPVAGSDSADIQATAHATQVTFTAVGIPGPATTLQVGGLSAPLLGIATNFGVAAKDQYGNVATSYRGTVGFTSTDPLAILPANYAFTAGDNGAHAFLGGITFGTGGTQTVTATDVGISSITGGQTVSVTGGEASTFVITGLPSFQVANDSQTITVTVKDGQGNTLTNYLGTVFFTSNDPLASFPLPYTFLVGDAGVKTFTDGVAFRTAGNRHLTVTDVALPTATGTSPAVTVSPTALAFLDVTSPGDSAVGGQTFFTTGTPYDLTVAARDTFFNLVPSFAGTVQFTAPLDPDATLPADYTFVPGIDAGQHLFAAGVTINAPGSQFVLVADGPTTGGLPVTALPPGMTAQWTGATSETWATASNWADGAVPGAADNVFIPFGVPFAPALASPVAINDLILADGATLNTNGFTITASGNVRAGNTITGSGTVLMTGVGKTVSGAMAELEVSGTVTVSGDVTLNSNLIVSGGDLILNGHTVDVANDLDVTGSTLSLSNPLDQLNVSGDATLTSGLMSGPGSLTVAANVIRSSGMILTIGTLSVGGVLTNSGTWGVTNTIFAGSGPQIIPAGLAYTNVTVTGAAQFTSGTNTISGNLTLAGTSLNLNGQTVNVSGNLTVTAGQLVMTSTPSVLNVAGDASFGGATINDQLTNGTLRIGGDFIQLPGSPQSFAAASNHITELNGSGAQSIAFANPGFAASSFANLRITNTNAGGVTLASNVFVDGTFSTADTTSNRFLFGGGNTLEARGWFAGGSSLNSTRLTINNVLVVMRPGALIQNTSMITFQGYAPTAVQLTVNRGAVTETLFFNHFVFSSAPTTGGAYLLADDSDNLGSTLLTINLQVFPPSPSNPGGFALDPDGIVTGIWGSFLF